MKKSFSIAALISITMMLIFVSACSQSSNSSDNESDNEGNGVVSLDNPIEEQNTVSDVLLQWQAGKTVTEQDVELYGGIDKCFSVDTIPKGIWLRMQGKSYKENPNIGRSDLRYIRALHWDYDQRIHVGEMVVNATIADKVVTILRKLYDARYPIQRMVLPDEYEDDESQMRDNNSSGFCYRTVARSGKLSKHAQGLAVDINTLYNPYYKDRSDGTRFVQPSTAEEYCDRSKEFPYKIDHDDLCYKLFKEAGFRWGGDFRSCKDYQHFEFVGYGGAVAASKGDSEEIEDDSDDNADELEEVKVEESEDIHNSVIESEDYGNADSNYNNTTNQTTEDSKDI